jgi:hypothetical protein
MAASASRFVRRLAAVQLVAVRLATVQFVAVRLAAARLVAVLLLAFLQAGPAPAAEPVDLELVLAADVSRSITEEEFVLQRRGYAAAFMDPRVLQAIQAGRHRAIAVTFVEWSSSDEQLVVVDWTVLRDGETAGTFADRLLAAPRSFQSRTSISAAIDFALRRFAASGTESARRLIDISGDGTNNSGRDVALARDEAVAAGVTINGLAIINDNPEGPYALMHVRPPEGLPEYYRRNVVGGPSSFVLQVTGFDTFADAIVEKLLQEIAGMSDPRDTAPSTSARMAAPGRR